jgi:hypothetical protein
MQSLLLFLHNLVRWLIVLFAILTLINGLSGMSGKKPFTSAHKRQAMFLMICCDIQLLLGLSLYFMNDWYTKLSDKAAMAVKETRFFAIEHSVGMLLAIILVHIGYSSTKKAIADGAKFKRMFWFTLLAAIIIAGVMPWGRPLFRSL